MHGKTKLPQPTYSGDTSTHRWLRLRAAARLFKLASSEWVDDNAQRLGASVAFYTLLSLAPLILIAIAVAAAVYGQEAAQGWMASEIRDVAGPDVARTVHEIITGARRPGTGVFATLLGLATLLFGASSIFVELHDAMNIIWHVAPPRDRTNAARAIRLIRDRFYSFATVLGAGCLMLASVGLSVTIAAMNIAVPRIVSSVILYVVVAAVFAALYKIVPDLTLRWRDVIPGAMITSLLFMVGKRFIELYFAHARLGSTYSAAGSPIVVLLWVYYSAQLFFWGAEFSKVYKRAAGFPRDPRH